MNWFMQTRQDWIVEMLEIYGFINREHICSKFGVTKAVASEDIKNAMDAYPDLMEFCTATKAYWLRKGWEGKPKERFGEAEKRLSDYGVNAFILYAKAQGCNTEQLWPNGDFLSPVTREHFCSWRAGVKWSERDG